MANTKQTHGFEKLIQRLHDPLQLRVACTGLMLTIGYMGIYSPLSAEVEEAHQLLRTERERRTLGNDVDSLRAQANLFRDRIPVNTDANEWVQYVLDGTRRFSLTLKQMDSKKPQRLGPYEAVGLTLELEGRVHELDALLDWLESNERLFRVDAAKITPVRDDTQLHIMQLTLLGLKG